MAQTIHEFKGLTDAEVLESRQKHGANVITPVARDPWWKQWLEKFNDPIIRILIVAAFVAILVGIIDGKFYEGIVIIVTIFLATTLGFINEYKANKEFDILNKVNDEVPVKVIRNDEITSIPKKDLVVDDIVLLDTGDEVPADAEVLRAMSLKVDESKLTGESMPVKKTPEDDTSEKVENAYPSNKVFRGTNVSEGRGTIRLLSVGDKTEIGQATQSASEETGNETPLNRQLGKLSKLIGVIAFGVAAFLYLCLILRDFYDGKMDLIAAQWYFLISVIVATLVALIPVWIPIVYDLKELINKKTKRPQWVEEGGLFLWLKSCTAGIIVLGISLGIGYFANPFKLAHMTDALIDHTMVEQLLEYFMVAVTLIVVAVPEGLPMSVTLSLAYSMRKMIKSNVLVRNMHACETIGAATVICTDKTGTLTLNEMRVQEIEAPCLVDKKLDSDRNKEQEIIINSISGNSTAHLAKDSHGADIYLGNPTEGATLFWLKDQGVDYQEYRNKFSIKKQWVFTTERKYMATVGSTPQVPEDIVYVKGAPEIVMQFCSQLLLPDGVTNLEDHRTSIKEKLEACQGRGMRTLGFAYRVVSEKDMQKTEKEVLQDLIWIGYCGIADGLRPETPGVVASCKEAGIKVKVLTGDNPLTAKEISRQIGLGQNKDLPYNSLTGVEFGSLPEEKLPEAAKNLEVLSRARPLDKLKLVKLLKAQNEVVAVTGDGTNDAPALNHADVGLAMGKTGTAVAKEASDIVIMDDSFQSIVNAVMWGRSLYQNIQKFILFQLTINFIAIGIVLFGPFIGINLPLTVIQMLWVNLIMDTFAALALATEPPQKSVMQKPPRHPESFIITPAMAENILIVGLIFLSILSFMIYTIQKNGINAQELTIFFTTFVMLQFWNMFNAKTLGRTESAFYGINQNKSFLLIAFVILLGQIGIVQFGGEQLFRTVPLNLKTWLIIIVATSPVLIVGEFIRWMMRIRDRRAKA